jgi:hypothetical protein
MLSRGYSGEPPAFPPAPLTWKERLNLLLAALVLAAILFFAFLTRG